MSEIVYNDEDNVPMNGEPYSPEDRNGHNPTIYLSYAEMRAAEEPLPFTDEPEKRCGNCREFNGSYCTKLWNNLDENYKDVFRDSKEPEDEACEDWEWDWEDEY